MAENITVLIKDYLREQGVEVSGIAGPDRLNGPPSLNPAYVLPGGKSIISFALPMDVPAIDDFLGKVSYVPHNLDQTRGNQKVFRVAHGLAALLQSRGVRARGLAPNNDYRRNPDVFSMHPEFSHRFGALAAGIGGQGWSGNVKTEEYGAAMYLGTVVTDAVLPSDPVRFGPRYFTDKYCKKCRLCARSCPAGMFREEEEEYVLLNRCLHPRGERRSVDLCNAACFGLHAPSPDKAWSTWAHHWVGEWLDGPPEPPAAWKVRLSLMLAGGKTGDSTARFDAIRKTASQVISHEVLEKYFSRQPENMDYAERFEAFKEFAKSIGASRVEDCVSDRVITCGHCALICGPTMAETARRYKTLTKAGMVAPAPDGGMQKAASFEEMRQMRRNNAQKPGVMKKLTDGAASLFLWHKDYFGIEPKGQILGFLYEKKRKKAVKERVWGHEEAR